MVFFIHAIIDNLSGYTDLNPWAQIVTKPKTTTTTKTTTRTTTKTTTTVKITSRATLRH